MSKDDIAKLLREQFPNEKEFFIVKRDFDVTLEINLFWGGRANRYKIACFESRHFWLYDHPIWCNDIKNTIKRLMRCDDVTMKGDTHKLRYGDGILHVTGRMSLEWLIELWNNRRI